MKKRQVLLWHKILLLLGSIIAAMFLGMAGVAWYSLQHVSGEIEKSGETILAFQTRSFLEKIIKGQAAFIDMGIEKAKAIAIHVALRVSETLEAQPKTNNVSLEMLQTLVEPGSNVIAAYFAPIHGNVIVYPASQSSRYATGGADLISKPHFPVFSSQEIRLGAVKLSRAHLSPFSLPSELLVDAVSPVVKDGEVQGFVGICLSVPQLIAQFHQLQPIRGSYSFLIDSQQVLVFAPPHARVDLAPLDRHLLSQRIKLDDPGNPALSLALSNMAMGHAALDEVPIKGTLKYFGYHPLRSIDWRFGFVMPVSIATSASHQLSAAVTETAEKALKRLSLWAVCLFVLSLFVGLALVEKIAAPIRTMIGVTRSMAQGDLAQRVTVTSRDEVGQLAADFNAMADRVQSMVDRLEKTNSHLQTRNEQLLIEMESRVQAQEQLRRAEERYRSIFENAVNGILQTSVEGRIMTANPATARLLGFDNPAELMEGWNINDFYLEPERRRELLEQLRSQGHAADYQLRMRTRDGRIIWVTIDARAVPTGKDGEFFLEGFFQDITARKAAEEESRALHLQLTQEHESRKRLSRELIGLLENERRRIAMELHDHIGQILTALKMDLEWAQTHHEGSNGEFQARISSAHTRTIEAMQEVREIAYTLRPSMLDNLGLVASLENLIHGYQKAFAVNLHFHSANVPQKLDAEKVTALYRVAQEAIWNALKHSGAKDIFISLVLRDKTLSLSIEDDGTGFDPHATAGDLETKGKMGLRIIQERVVQVGGELSWESGEGRGTHLLVEIPV